MQEQQTPSVMDQMTGHFSTILDTARDVTNKAATAITKATTSNDEDEKSVLVPLQANSTQPRNIPVAQSHQHQDVNTQLLRRSNPIKIGGKRKHRTHHNKKRKTHLKRRKTHHKKMTKYVKKSDHKKRTKHKKKSQDKKRTYHKRK